MVYSITVIVFMMLSTKELAQKYNAIETIHVNKRPMQQRGSQPFEYLLVLDFESTCWEQGDVKKGYPEIIEFSVVIYDIKQNKISEEFQQYVMPMENPRLSQFCIGLTGITQEQVDNGVPLGTCLMVFSKWLNDQQKKYNMGFPNNILLAGKKKCIFATWSNWDLGTCLNNECKRKRINKNSVFSQWIDVRLLYREYYLRLPKGLKGALNEVGSSFIGKEHSGLDDARNTATLIGKMIEDGVILRITKNLNIHHM